MDKVVGWVRCSAYDSEQNIFRSVGWVPGWKLEGRFAQVFDSEAFLQEQKAQE